MVKKKFRFTINPEFEIELPADPEEEIDDETLTQMIWRFHDFLLNLALKEDYEIHKKYTGIFFQLIDHHGVEILEETTGICK